MTALDKMFGTKLLYEKNFLLDGQTRRARSSSQLVNFPGARPLMKPLSMHIVYHVPEQVKK